MITHFRFHKIVTSVSTQWLVMEFEKVWDAPNFYRLALDGKTIAGPWDKRCTT